MQNIIYFLKHRSVSSKSNIYCGKKIELIHVLWRLFYVSILCCFKNVYLNLYHQPVIPPDIYHLPLLSCNINRIWSVPPLQPLSCMVDPANYKQIWTPQQTNILTKFNQIAVWFLIMLKSHAIISILKSYNKSI